MIKKTFFLLFCLFIFAYLNLCATVINIPDDYPEIQDGIDAASDSDTILVQPGTYIENLNYLGKDIVIGSLFLTTQNPDYIYQTIIDGNYSDSVVKFSSEESRAAVLCGFMITNGCAEHGGGIFCDYYTTPSLDNLVITGNHAEERGGGIFCQEDHSDPSLTNVLIHDNSADSGGGIASGTGYPNSAFLSRVTIANNHANRGGGIFWEGDDLQFSGTHRSNIYSNFAEEEIGNDLYFEYIYDIDVKVDTFSVLYPTNIEAYPAAEISFDILHGYAGNLVNADLFVATWGDDDNSGLTPDDPLQTIQCALNRIYEDNEFRNTIFIEEGIYSSSETGENFPIEHRTDYAIIKGSMDGETILDAEMQSGVLELENITESTISDLIIINGSAYSGGGILLINSNPTLVRLIITQNQANEGAGIFCSKNSAGTIRNSTVSFNIASDQGGAILHYSDNDIFIENSILWGNSPEEIVSFHGCSGNVYVSYSDIQDGFIGEAIIDEDPLFEDAQNGDFHLTWSNFPQPDSTKSPCIDAGNPDSDCDPDGTIADMGALYFSQLQNEINEDYFIDNTATMPSLKPNYPNPFNPETTFSYELISNAIVKIEIFNIKGQKVEILVDKIQDKGEHSLQWNASEYNSGIYFIKFSCAGFQEIQKAVLLK